MKTFSFLKGSAGHIEDIFYLKNSGPNFIRFCTRIEMLKGKVCWGYQYGAQGRKKGLMPDSMWDLGFTRQHLNSNTFLSLPNQTQWVPLLVGIKSEQNTKNTCHTQQNWFAAKNPKTMTPQAGVSSSIWAGDAHSGEEKTSSHAWQGQSRKV